MAPVSLPALEYQCNEPCSFITKANNCSDIPVPAGNIYSSQARTTPQDLVTPTIKQDVYTTGRGGSGNMVHNDPEHPELARESQDVEAPPVRIQEGAHHTGRGRSIYTLPCLVDYYLISK